MLDVAMFNCSPFPFKPRLLRVLPSELSAEATGRRSGQPISQESISVDVDHRRARQHSDWWRWRLGRSSNWHDAMDESAETCGWQRKRRGGGIRRVVVVVVVVVVVARRRRASSSSSRFVVVVVVGRHLKQPREYSRCNGRGLFFSACGAKLMVFSSDGCVCVTRKESSSSSLTGPSRRALSLCRCTGALFSAQIERWTRTEKDPRGWLTCGTNWQSKRAYDIFSALLSSDGLERNSEKAPTVSLDPGLVYVDIPRFVKPKGPPVGPQHDDMNVLLVHGTCS